MFVCSPHCVEEIASCSESCCFYRSGSHVKDDRFDQAALMDPFFIFLTGRSAVRQRVSASAE